MPISNWVCHDMKYAGHWSLKWMEMLGGVHCYNNLSGTWMLQIYFLNPMQLHVFFSATFLSLEPNALFSAHK